jgi:hypothetical protein
MSISLREELIGFLGITEKDLSRLITRSPYTYKKYYIKKKSGGVRRIAQPAKETKFIQYWLMSNVFSKLPVHDCATAYKLGASIKNNAMAHKHNSYIAKYDFIGFFSSIKYNDILSHVSRYFNGYFCDGDIKDIARISCINEKGDEGLCLSVGAPSSPVLSNAIMFDFDCYISAWCSERNIVYTRYADDLTFSTNIKGVSASIEPVVRELMRDMSYPRLMLNDNKTIHLSKKHQRRITGLIIDNNENISIGRCKKREISALIHRFSLGLLSEADIYRLQGLLGFANDSEPLFIHRISEKYGAKLIEDIFKKRKK